MGFKTMIILILFLGMVKGLCKQGEMTFGWVQNFLNAFWWARILTHKTKPTNHFPVHMEVQGLQGFNKRKVKGI